jgi:DNA modification methylase
MQYPLPGTMSKQEETITSYPTDAVVVIGDAQSMPDQADESVHLVVTSPPYWQIKDYSVCGQIGYHQTYREYIGSLNRVWQECYRVLHPGCRLCVNIGDQFARAVIYGRYKIIPIHADIIAGCESVGFDYMGAIVWQKQTTMNTTGGATVMGSYPYPRNGIVKLDYEFILLFRKLGSPPKAAPEQKEASRLTQEEWETYFAGHWCFAGERQTDHLAMFPEELPRRLIKMFTFVGDTVLDPFLGSGTTVMAARKLGRHAIGCEVNPEYLPLIQKKAGTPLTVIHREQNAPLLEPVSDPETNISLNRLNDPKRFRFGSVVSQEDKGKPSADMFRVKSVPAAKVLQLHTGLRVRLIGLKVEAEWEPEAKRFLERIVLRQKVRLEYDEPRYDEDGMLQAYIYSENKTFLNAKLIREGYACFDGMGRLAAHLQRCEQQAKSERKGVWANEDAARV